jgi:UDP-N-acetylmuramyl pentapeptide phosphotransferase/UDP-N-acetylglucosamine-1-phosphate transferase
MSIAPAVSFFVCAALLAVLLRWPHWLPLDRPNARSLHSGLVPRAGGLALFPATLAGWAFITPFPWPIAGCVIALAVASFLDDRRGLPVVLRLALHLAAASIFAAGLPSGLSWMLLAAAVLAVAWSINLYNFMDGADGLAGGMALFGFGAYAAAAWQQGANGFAMLNLCVAASALGFLTHNFPPARVFLGDAGSVPLGYLAAALGMSGLAFGLWPWWFPLLVFSPFAVDATATLARRALRGERIWQAHREHYYQRLVRSGWTHRRTALAEYLLMAAAAISALWAAGLDAPWQNATLLAWTACYAVLMLLVDRHWRAAQSRPGTSA